MKIISTSTAQRLPTSTADWFTHTVISAKTIIASLPSSEIANMEPKNFMFNIGAMSQIILLLIEHREITTINSNVNLVPLRRSYFTNTGG